MIWMSCVEKKNTLWVFWKEWKQKMEFLILFYVTLLKSRLNVKNIFGSGRGSGGLVEEVTAQRNRYQFSRNRYHFFGVNPLHGACDEGDLQLVKKLLNEQQYMCFQQDMFGRTPLHIAVEKGRLHIVNMFIKYCPESVTELTATGETCLHIAVSHNKTRVVQRLLKWFGERRRLLNRWNCDGITGERYLLNSWDCEGNTALHLSTSRKQLQTLKVLLNSELVDVNALNSGGFTALDILNVLPYSGKIDMEIDMILREAGAMRARDLTNQGIKKQSDDYCFRGLSNRSSDICTVNSVIRTRDILLVIAILLATTTFQAALHLPDSTSSVGYVYNSVTGTIQKNKQDSIIFSSIILFNSIAFLGSLGTTISLLHEFPLKPWPQISVSAMFGSYICAIMAASPSEALALLLISIPFLLLAAAGKLHGFASQSFL